RPRPGQDVNDLAAAQITRLARLLPPTGPTPLFVFAAGYDPVELALALDALGLDALALDALALDALGQAPAAVLVRRRRPRCLSAAPAPPRAPPPRRAPPRPVARAGTTPSSPAGTRAPGPRRAASTARMTPHMATCASARGRACTPSRRTTDSR